MIVNSINRGVEMWHLGYNGPRTVEYIESFPPPNGPMVAGDNKNKTVVLFHGVPEVVEDSELYDNAADCYMAAASLEMSKASDAMVRAADYQGRATAKQKATA
jgi:hypothetical protein